MREIVKKEKRSIRPPVGGSESVKDRRKIALGQRFSECNVECFQIVRNETYVGDELDGRDVLNERDAEPVEKDTAGRVHDEVTNTIFLRFVPEEYSFAHLQPEALSEEESKKRERRTPKKSQVPLRNGASLGRSA